MEVLVGGALLEKFNNVPEQSANVEPVHNELHPRSQKGQKHVTTENEKHFERKLRQVKNSRCKHDVENQDCDDASTKLQLLNDKEPVAVDNERLTDLEMGHRLEDELKMSSSEREAQRLKLYNATDEEETLDRRKKVDKPLSKGNGLVHYKPPKNQNDSHHTTKMINSHHLKQKSKDQFQTSQNYYHLQVSDQPRSECSHEIENDDSVVRAAVLLPNNTDYIMSLTKVLPVLKLAQQEVNRRQLLPGNLSFQFLPRDDHCDAVYAQISTFEAVKKNVHVFFGPACEYSVGKCFFQFQFTLYTNTRLHLVVLVLKED